MTCLMTSVFLGTLLFILILHALVLKHVPFCSFIDAGLIFLFGTLKEMETKEKSFCLAHSMFLKICNSCGFVTVEQALLGVSGYLQFY